MVLLSQMYLAERMFIRKGFSKREARRFKEKYVHPPSCESTCTVTSYSCWLFGNKVPMAHTALSEAFYSLMLATALWTNLESVSNGPMNIFIP